ncbi:hypothetical protein A2291_02725 [candidate division WOR-1 bacterium RIFOXYB2_FULL_42_35]|uniref:Thioester reductase (TE) domain-containing protein n=1 Tax=candidate division WOR-1 bacterium RIFOXYC2_FULL_41_25 TaxID=1802586 RepID=A0A1F4TJZ6_UNCSA|nr:MAG: hypothetical protein A2247_04185 [candidate division WOR-1 bacterium RIFOXYA2_FULL_41_14]OGC22079.1 MAG: hypothetical protein A2291_02725 [candidate division WOR-1 bacterium RIFOXYB2_FULL_42_35]OGC32840.1 MAG: hypothetical protein A2462_06525 [candidate division WOR-1 bacterium RIFOXYC2_FULL_41_25]OGC43338.1 MAG: hypothetical protein A2548_03175 [candidate division WOR-1 bacterium RIFOXYD2_FULL_41_8]
MRIAITGATGLLGRNLVFEIIKQNINNLNDLEIIVLGRDEKNMVLSGRMKYILLEDGFDYLGIRDKERNQKLEEINKCIVSISFDLSKDKLAISDEDFAILKGKTIDYFFHLAALTDFRNTPKVRISLDEINIKGTNRILKLISALDIGEMIYVGSAYSCGNAKGLVKPDHVNLEGNFRNYYEETKLVAENNFKKYADNHKKRYRIFRPIGISGRLIEQPIGATCKYDVFYGWTIFFFKQKYKHFGTFNDIYTHPLNIPVRIWASFNSGLNIVPSDYAAKLMYAACIYADPGRHYHLVNDIEISHTIYLKIILDDINVKGYSFVEKMPMNLNRIEKFYYQTVGKLFTPYANCDSVSYDIESIVPIRKKIGLACPLMTPTNFKRLIDFAKVHCFGLARKKLTFGG